MLNLFYYFFLIFLLLSNNCSTGQKTKNIKVSDILSGNQKFFNTFCKPNNKSCFDDQKILSDPNDDQNWICCEDKHFKTCVSRKPVKNFELTCNSDENIFKLLQFHGVSELPFPVWIPLRRENNTKPYKTVNSAANYYYNTYGFPSVKGNFKNNNCIISNGTDFVAVNCNERYHQICIHKGYGIVNMTSNGLQFSFLNNTSEVNCSICEENFLLRDFNQPNPVYSIRIQIDKNNYQIKDSYFDHNLCFRGNYKLHLKESLSNYFRSRFDLDASFALRYSLIDEFTKKTVTHEVLLRDVDYPRYYWCETLTTTSNILYYYDVSKRIRIYNVIVSFIGCKNCYPIDNLPDLNDAFLIHKEIVKDSAFAFDLLYYDEISGCFQVVYQFARDLISSNMYEENFIEFVFEILKENNFTVDTIYNTQFCLEDETRDFETEMTLHWPETKVGTVQVSKELCLDEQSIPARRKCDFNITQGPFWSPVDGFCTKNVNELEHQLYDLYKSNKSSNELLENLSKISSKIQKRSTVAEIDLSVKIIEKSLKDDSIASNVNTLQIVDNLMMSKRDVLLKAQDLLNSTDQLLYNIDKLIEKSEDLYSTEHIKVMSANLSKSNVIGWGINEKLQIIEFHINDTLENIKQVFKKENLTTAFYLSEDNLQQLQELHNFNDMKLIASFFHNDALFNPDSLSSKDTKYQPPLRIQIKGFNGFFNDSLKILYKHNPGKNSSFAYWDFGFDDQQYPKKGHWEIIDTNPEVEDIFIARTYHPAYFSVLVTGHSEDNESLRLITIIGCSFSLAGCLIICIIVLISRTIRKEKGTKLFINILISIVSTYVLFFIAEAVQRQVESEIMEIVCLSVGHLLHYMLLAQFSWTLILSYFQYARYVIIHKTDTTYLILKYSFLTWFLPLFPIILSFFFQGRNDVLDSNLCYVSKTTLKNFILLPMTMILTSNLAVLIVIGYSLVFKKRLKVDKKYFASIVKMLCFNFIFLSLNWISGIVLFFDYDNVILSYIFNITSTFQGFVVSCIFVFTSKKKIFSRSMQMRNIGTSMESSNLLRQPVVERINRINEINSI